MKIDITMDLDKFDERIKTMSKERKANWFMQIKFLTKLSRKLLAEGKISKTCYNRAVSIWNFSPYQNVYFMSSKKFNELMGVKTPSLINISKAIKEVLSKGKSEGTK